RSSVTSRSLGAWSSTTWAKRCRRSSTAPPRWCCSTRSTGWRRLERRGRATAFARPRRARRGLPRGGGSVRSPPRRILSAVQRHRELVLPCLVAAILGALVVPLPDWLLDLGLAVNLVAAAALLVAALRAAGPLELSAFPTLLLV